MFRAISALPFFDENCFPYRHESLHHSIRYPNSFTVSCAFSLSAITLPYNVPMLFYVPHQPASALGAENAAVIRIIFFRKFRNLPDKLFLLMPPTPRRLFCIGKFLYGFAAILNADVNIPFKFPLPNRRIRNVDTVTKFFPVTSSS